MKYYLYILETINNTLYTGITTDIKRRFKEHLNEPKGAKYTKANKPKSVVYLEIFNSRKDASKKEYEIKHNLKRQDKLDLIEKNFKKTNEILKEVCLEF